MSYTSLVVHTLIPIQEHKTKASNNRKKEERIDISKFWWKGKRVGTAEQGNGYPTMFSLQIHHGGEFSKFPGRQYKPGSDLDTGLLALGTDNDEIEYDGMPNQDDEPDCEDGFDASDEEYGSKDDVEVDMNDFHSKFNLIDVAHEDNLNIDILDNEDFDSNSEGEEGQRTFILGSNRLQV
ncbi:hypothetical protein LXL04_001849 [Taraxacum kok-saghyz]